MARVLRWVAIIFSGLVVLAVAAFFMIDWNRAGDWAADRLTQMTGREFAINGDVDIDWSWSPRITVNDITIANEPWGTEPLMAAIQRVEAVVRIPPLLRGRLELPEVSVTRPQVLLEMNEQGEGNWNLNSAPAEAATPTEREDVPVLGRLVIADGELTFRDPTKDVNVTSRVDTVGQGGDGEGNMNIKGEGTLAGKPLRVELTAGPILMLRETEEPYPVDLRVEAGGTKVALVGTFKEPVQLQGADLKLDLSGPNLAEIFPLFGIPTPVTDAYSLAGQVRREGNLWQVENLAGKVGQSDLSGWMSLEPKEPRPLIRAELASNTLRLEDLGGLVGVSPGDHAKQGEPPAADNKLLPDMPIETERLKAADMDVSYKGGDVQVPVLPLREVAFRLRLENGRAIMDPLQLQAEIGRIAGRAMLDGSGEIPVADFDINISGVGLKPFFAGTRFENDTEGTVVGRVRLKGQGESLAAILGQSNGEMAMVIDSGRMSSLLIEAAGVDIAEALADLIGDDEAVPIRCGVWDMGVKQGVMQSRAFVLDTEDTNIGGNLTLNLKSEEIDARILAEPKDASPLAARVPVTVGGTLTSPKIGVEAEGLAARGAAAVVLGVVATPLAAVLPFIDTGGGENSPCGTLIREAKKPGADGSPTGNAGASEKEQESADTDEGGEESGNNEDSGNEEDSGNSDDNSGNDGEEN
ncbi:AsmA family protein [Indioceanicola profundi]|uniref:AsmA family protein n=1 Tax=Indioceanicola profundi TaxID=2220096 RepID=UPI000E6ABB07|nr:AsmA family protein [Indioceanicola profundi]